MHSACGLLDADFRTPSLDYADLIKASRQLCRSPAVGQLQFEVVAHRLQHEYSADVRIQGTKYTMARWIAAASTRRTMPSPAETA